MIKKPKIQPRDYRRRFDLAERMWTTKYDPLLPNGRQATRPSNTTANKLCPMTSRQALLMLREARCSDSSLVGLGCASRRCQNALCENSRAECANTPKLVALYEM